MTAMAIADFPLSEGGRGAVALKDIPVSIASCIVHFTSNTTKEGHILFSIPRNLTLSTRTSSLPSVFGLEAWKNLELHEGWSGLILSIIWEGVQGSNSRWAEYLSEPITFSLEGSRPHPVSQTSYQTLSILPCSGMRKISLNF